MFWENYRVKITKAVVNCFKNIDRLFFCLLLIGAYSPTIPMVTLADVYLESSELKGDKEVKLRGMIWYGKASWYGPKFHGKRTSNGEKFNKNKLTAAHRTLPFNTKVLVTNLKNNKSVVVRINDRGPFIGNRIIDLSEKAASEIGSKKEGIAYIKLQVLRPAPTDQT